MVFYVVYQEAFLPAAVQGQAETNQAPKNERRNGGILADIVKVTSDDLDEEIVVTHLLH